MPGTNSTDQRVTILIDTETHMMPALAREQASQFSAIDAGWAEVWSTGHRSPIVSRYGTTG